MQPSPAIIPKPKAKPKAKPQENNPKSKEGEEIGKQDNVQKPKEILKNEKQKEEILKNEKQKEETPIPLVEDVKQVEFIPKIYPEIIATAIVSFGGLMIGFMFGWTDPAIHSIERNNTFHGLDFVWLAAIAFLGAIVGSIFVGIFINHLGRKVTMIILTIPVALGWFLTAITPYLNKYWILYLGRFLEGTSGGFSFVVTVYVAEISSDKIRGILCSVLTCVLAFGILISYSLGLWLNYAQLGVFNLLCMVPFAILLPFLPESPYYLVQIGQIDEAAIALRRFRGAKTVEQIQPELDMLIQGKKEKAHLPITIPDLITTSILKPFCTSLGLMAFQQWSAIAIVVALPGKIFEAAGSSLDSQHAAIIIASVEVIVVIGGMFLIELLGRKVLLLISEVGVSISLLALSTGMYYRWLSDNSEEEFTLGWLPIVSLCLYTVSFNLGIGPIPWVMLGEIIPPRVKGIASTIVCSFVWALSFIIIMIYFKATDQHKTFISLFIFTGLSLVGNLFIIFVVKETRGRGLEEIYQLYS